MSISVSKKPDQFMVVTREFFDEIKKHLTGFGVLIAILFVIGLVTAYRMSHKEELTNAGRDALFSAQKALDKEVADLQAAAPKLDSAPAETSKTGKTQDKAPEKAQDNKVDLSHAKLDVDAKFPQGTRALHSVIDKYSGTRPGYEARLVLADLYYDHGDVDKAIPLYREAIAHAPSKQDRALSIVALGYSFENHAQYKEAIETFEDGLNQGDSALKGDLLMAVARCYEATHDSAKARDTYDRVARELPNTQYAKSAEIYKSQLE